MKGPIQPSSSILAPSDEIIERFEEAHRQQFGFISPEKSHIVEALCLSKSSVKVRSLRTLSCQLTKMPLNLIHWRLSQCIPQDENP